MKLSIGEFFYNTKKQSRSDLACVQTSLINKLFQTFNTSITFGYPISTPSTNAGHHFNHRKDY